MTSKDKGELDIQYLYRGENLWQFRIAEGTPLYHTKSFSDSGRHNDVSLEEARSYRNAYLAAHPELLDMRLPLRIRLQKNNRTGIVGVNYSETTLPSGTVACDWQMTCPRPGGGTPKTARFSARKFGESRALMMAVQARREATREFRQAQKSPGIIAALDQLIDEYEDIIAELQQSLTDDSESKLLSIIREARLDATSKRTEIHVRLGQHRFRRLVLVRWEGRCAITGADILVEASHIKPWRLASNFDRINPDNGIALSLLYHRAFDLGYISFADDGSMLVSEAVRDQLVRVGMNLSARIAGFTDGHSPFLQHHRTAVFDKKRNELQP